MSDHSAKRAHNRSGARPAPLPPHAATRNALFELNSTSTQTIGCTFTEAIVHDSPAEKVQKKPTNTEWKRAQWKMLRKCRDHLKLNLRMRKIF